MRKRTNLHANRYHHQTTVLAAEIAKSLALLAVWIPVGTDELLSCHFISGKP